jgi:hypothetical protein
MALSDYVYFLWYVQQFQAAILLALLWRKQLYRQFPYFTLYLLFDLMAFPIGLVLIHGKYAYYFWAAVTVELVEMGLMLLSLRELYIAAMKHFTAFRTATDTLFKAVVGMLAFSTIGGSLWLGFREKSAIISFKFTVEEIVYATALGFVILLSMTARYLGIRFRGLVFGIALGFGLTSGLDLLAVSLRHSFGFAAAAWVQLVLPLAAEVVARFIWGAYLLLPITANVAAPLPASHFSSLDLALARLLSIHISPKEETPALR